MVDLKTFGFLSNILQLENIKMSKIGNTNDLLNVINVLPITSRKNNRSIYPNEVLIPAGISGLSNESIVLCYQIRTIDKRRLNKRYGILQDDVLKEEIIEALKFQLGLL